MRRFCQRPRLAVWAGFAGIALAILAEPGSWAAPPEKQGQVSAAGCRRFPLSRPPLWTGSGAWRGEDLILVDTIRRSLLSYSSAGSARPESSDPLARTLRDLYPSRIAGGGNEQIVIQVEPDRFIFTDHGQLVKSSASISSFPSEKGDVIGRIYDWALAAKDIVAFAEIKNGKGGKEDWAAGIVRLSVDSFGSFKVINKVGIHGASRKFHRLGYSYITSLGSSVYYVLMENGVHLWKQEKGKDPQDFGDFRGLFPEWEHLPALPEFVRPQDLFPTMSVVEGSTMPTALYEWEGSIYMVSRQRKDGKQQWFLTKINPGNGAALGTYRIASDANHLFPVPGSQYWAFIEKGPTLGLQEQSVKSIYVIPSGSLRKRFSDSKKGDLLDICQ